MNHKQFTGIVIAIALVIAPWLLVGKGLGIEKMPLDPPAPVSWQDGADLPQEKAAPKQEPEDPDSIGRRDYMRMKLMHTQNIIEGLTQKDFGMIEEAARKIREITEGASWNAVDSDEYRFQSREFQRSVDDLIHAAEGRNVEATTLRFFGVTTKCVDCHEHLRKRSDF